MGPLLTQHRQDTAYDTLRPTDLRQAYQYDRNPQGTSHLAVADDLPKAADK